MIENLFSFRNDSREGRVTSAVNLKRFLKISGEKKKLCTQDVRRVRRMERGGNLSTRRDVDFGGKEGLNAENSVTKNKKQKSGAGMNEALAFLKYAAIVFVVVLLIPAIARAVWRND